MLTREELAATVRTVVSDVLGTEPEELRDRTSLADDYGIDSLELMEIGARLERTLRLRIDPDDLISARDVGHAVDLLHARLRDPATAAPGSRTANAVITLAPPSGGPA
ncbi:MULTISPECIES: acyl carrier protein [Kitasatospora]|uniref:Putative acyl carrier protein n=1 Tax=Kitasatospora setae (strain ATCC 33774 / DSM 43861 / JCM 3304 / KCC A-0304 / NBRC 14216 / KM-6054) TaxID=452652 RepID=E4N0N1_KITSK|nr:acyl carrier protein [Kitasatospora setae]BAJ31715.1 putative acyl carrier protein [Kitasatospora setae KM-6054]